MSEKTTKQVLNKIVSEKTKNLAASKAAKIKSLNLAEKIVKNVVN